MQHNDTVIDTAIEPRRLPIASGWHWVTRAFALYRAHWLQWTVMTALFLAIPLLLAATRLDWIWMVTSLVMPILSAGLLESADRAQRGGPVNVGDLFNGFKYRTRQLLRLGIWYLVAMAALTGLLTLILRTLAAQAGVTFEQIQQQGLAELVSGPGLALFGIVGVAGMILIYSFYFFAPALVTLREVKAVEAMRLSYVAFWRNLAPLLVTSVVLVLLTAVAASLLMVGLIVVTPVGLLVSYTAFADIFDEDLVGGHGRTSIQG
ncbi:BPSS1780 family membrane protein [Chitiniphilus purpureus]|uniref:BPSS1780 family membrane protein n=1 Tax=Chitiniphilus purpureus TaxID=2981137 RepID=A0ABY6DQA7_9NEIS|nr:BPSS1780 family membrane protein [Chitiniphilus sp. CD1]UXY15671.1 BPSS1780 family membrane protein [Chitiniphilus sp. CD1]